MGNKNETDRKQNTQSNKSNTKIGTSIYRNTPRKR